MTNSVIERHNAGKYKHHNWIRLLKEDNFKLKTNLKFCTVCGKRKKDD